MSFHPMSGSNLTHLPRYHLATTNVTLTPVDSETELNIWFYSLI